MRYFKYKNTNKNEKNALKEQYKILTADEKLIFRKRRMLEKCGCFLMILIFWLTAAFGIFLINLIPTPSDLIFKILCIILKTVLAVVMLYVSVVLAAVLTIPVWSKTDSLNIPEMKKEIFSKACAHLREFYGLDEPYIITKCFDSTDEKFKNCDVCIFICGGEVRITKDIVSGFLHGEKDIGCYAFEKDEITLTKRTDGKCLRCELSSNDTTFLLGYKARKYISENFILKQ